MHNIKAMKTVKLINISLSINFLIIRLAFLSILLCCCQIIDAQDISFEKFIVKDLKTAKTLTGVNCKLPNAIADYHLDSSRGLLYLVLRKNQLGNFTGAGKLFCIDLNTNSVQWSTFIREENYNVKFCKDYILLGALNNTTICLDKNDGKKLHTISKRFAFADPQLNIAVTFEGVGYDLNKNRSIWDNGIVNEVGWTDLLLLDKHSILAVAGDFNYTELETGKGWSVIKKGQVSNSNEEALVAGAAVLGIAAAMLTGVGFVAVPSGDSKPIIYKDYAKPIVSDKVVYLAHRHAILSVNKAGGINWTTSLPWKMTSNATLVEADSNIFLLNNGFAFYNGGMIRLGRIYIASFSKQSGQQNHLTLLPFTSVQSSCFNDDTLALRCNDTLLLKYNAQNGTQVLQRTISSLNVPKYNSFISPELYYTRTNTNEYICLKEQFPNNYFMRSVHSDISQFDPELNEIHSFNQSEVYIFYKKQNDMVLIKNSNNSITFLRNNKAIASIAGNNIVLYQNKTISLNGTQLSIYDLAFD